MKLSLSVVQITGNLIHILLWDEPGLVTFFLHQLPLCPLLVFCDYRLLFTWRKVVAFHAHIRWGETGIRGTSLNLSFAPLLTVACSSFCSTNNSRIRAAPRWCRWPFAQSHTQVICFCPQARSGAQQHPSKWDSLHPRLLHLLRRFPFDSWIVLIRETLQAGPPAGGGCE